MGYQETENVIFNQIEDPPNAESTRAGPTEEDNPRVAPEDESRAENYEEVVKSTIIFNIRTIPNIQVSPGVEVETRKERTNDIETVLDDDEEEDPDKTMTTVKEGEDHDKSGGISFTDAWDNGGMVTPKETSTPGIPAFLTISGSSNLKIVRDRGSPFRMEKDGNPEEGAKNMAKNILKRGRKEKDHEWLKEALGRILDGTKIILTKENKAIAVNRTGTDRDGEFSTVLLGGNFIEVTMRTAESLKIENIQDYSRTRATFLHLMEIAERYKPSDVEIKNIEELTKGSERRAKHYRDVLRQLIARMVQAEVLPSI